MKRMVWLLLAVVGTALAQVQPVTFAIAQSEACSCCDGNGSCGMPGCLPPAPAPTVLTATSPSSITVTKVRRAITPAGLPREKFYVCFVEPAAVQAAARAPERVTPPASVPLFAAHCSFLI